MNYRPFFEDMGILGKLRITADRHFGIIRHYATAKGCIFTPGGTFGAQKIEIDQAERRQHGEPTPAASSEDKPHPASGSDENGLHAHESATDSSEDGRQHGGQESGERPSGDAVGKNFFRAGDRHTADRPFRTP